MNRHEFDNLCEQHPGAQLSGTGELDAWKVGGKMFACFGHIEKRSHQDQDVAVKCPDIETAAMLIEAGAASKAPYFHRSWVQLKLATFTPDDALHRITISYKTILRGLSKSVREAL